MALGLLELQAILREVIADVPEPLHIEENNYRANGDDPLGTVYLMDRGRQILLHYSRSLRGDFAFTYIDLKSDILAALARADRKANGAITGAMLRQLHLNGKNPKNIRDSTKANLATIAEEGENQARAIIETVGGGLDS